MTLHIAILGMGQLGGSLALSVQQHLDDVVLYGYDSAPGHTEHMHAKGAIQHTCHQLKDAVSKADILFLACPLLEYPALIDGIAPYVKTDAIISDVGSVQRALHDACAPHPGLHVIPSHPIAGSERQGPETARDDLFHDRLLLLTPDNPKQYGVTRMMDFWRGLRVREVLCMPHPLHDLIYAHMSHLPHLLAYAAGLCLQQHGVKNGAQDQTLAQFLRIGQSNPRMWADIACVNQSSVLPALQNVRAILSHIAQELTQDEAAQAPPGENAANATPTAFAQMYLPQLIASSLITCVASLETQHQINVKPFGGAGLHDTISPAHNAPENMMQAISNAPLVMAAILESYTDSLAQLERAIQAQDHATLLAHITTMQHATKDVLY